MCRSSAETEMLECLKYVTWTTQDQEVLRRAELNFVPLVQGRFNTTS